LRRSQSIIADASFFLCFLDDIKQPKILVVLLNNFVFHLPPAVLDEVKASRSYSQINLHKNMHLMSVSGYDYGAILKPFLGTKQLDRGEGEAIALAYVWQSHKKCDRLILDDGEARQFVQTNLPILLGIMTGTVGFIGHCYYSYALFDQQQALDLLTAVAASSFRIKDKDLSNVRKRITGC
jgi:predicted nucleic acid-binding protein